jgi:predicted metallopeptidase
LHIPKGFTGGFRPHKGYINHEIVEHLHRTFKKQKIAKKTSF